MKKLRGFILLTAIFLYGQASFAGSDSGIYIGGSMGQASLYTGNTSFDIDEDASGYKVILGYNFGLVPTIDLAIEADYRDFGSFDNSANDSADLTSYDVYGLAGINFGPVGVFGKLGFSNTDIDSVIDDVSQSDSDSSNTYGLGAKIGLGSLAVRAEYEVFDIDGVDDVSMTSLGVILTF